MKFSISLLALLVFIIAPLSSVYAGGGFELKPNQFKGEIIQKKGPNLVGYIELNGDEMNPWKNQKSVQFFTEEATADGKVKGKEKIKYKPSDIKGYICDGRNFVSMEISESKVTSGIGLGKKWMFLEEFEAGKVSLYKLYSTPDYASVTTTEEQRVARLEELDSMRNYPCLVLIKEGSDTKCAESIDLRDFIGDCEVVTEKYLNGDYGITPHNPDAGTKLGKMIANASNSGELRGVISDILRDYNETCGE